MSDHTVTEIPLTAPRGFRVVRREVDDGLNLVEYIVSIDTKSRSVVSAESLDNPDFSRLAVDYALRSLARAVRDQCEAILR